MSRAEWFELVGRAVLWFAGAAYIGDTAYDVAADLVPSHPLFAALWVMVVCLPLWVAPMVVVYLFAVRPIVIARHPFAKSGEVPPR